MAGKTKDVETDRRGFLKLAGSMLALPAVPAAVRFAVNEQLVGEAKAMARLQHPHIVAIHDVQETEGGAYVVFARIPPS